MYDQMYKYFDQILSTYECGFCQDLDKAGLGDALITIQIYPKPSTALSMISWQLNSPRMDLIHIHEVLFSVTLMRENKEQKYLIPAAPTLI